MPQLRRPRRPYVISGDQGIDIMASTDNNALMQEIIHDVLRDQSIQLRNMFPDVYAKVDEILAQPDRNPHKPQARLPKDENGLSYSKRVALGKMTEEDKEHLRAQRRRYAANRRAKYRAEKEERWNGSLSTP
jgi:hypothetical protein